MLRLLLAASVSSASFTFAAAQALPDVTKMTCAQAQAFIVSHKQVVMSTGPTTYERFVSQDNYCLPDGYAAADFEHTLDNPQCMVGYYCHDKPYESR